MHTIENEEQLGTALDQHNEEVMSLSVSIVVLYFTYHFDRDASRDSLSPRSCRSLEQARLLAISEHVSRLSGEPSVLHLVFLHQEQLSDLKKNCKTSETKFW